MPSANGLVKYLNLEIYLYLYVTFYIPYLKFNAVDSFVTTVHNILVSNRPGNTSGSSIYKSPALVQRCSFAVYCISKDGRIQPCQIQRSEQMVKASIYVINYLQE